MIELTPFRAAAIGLLAVAVLTFAVSLSNRLSTLLDQSGTSAGRAELRDRFRGYTLWLVGGAVLLVLASEALR